jgi:hypothetical protein
MSVRLAGPYNSGVAAGGAGVATANADTPTVLRGRVVGIYVDYLGTSPPATTDVTIKTKGVSPNAPSYNLLVLTNANTDGWFYPQVQIHDTTGTPIATEYTPQLVNDQINILIAQADNDNNVNVWFILEEF